MDKIICAKQIKIALTNLYDLSFLRHHPFAALLPPTYLAKAKGDVGLAVQQLLLDGLEHIKPPELPSSTELEWRPYRALYYKYLREQSLQELAHTLGVCQRGVQRAQKEAIAGVAKFLRETVRSQCLLLSPSVPRIENFAGRQEELAFYHRQLEREHWAVIVGTAGVGKTALGAELATRWKTQTKGVSWIEFRQGLNTNLETLLETMAISLAAQGHDSFWLFLQADRRRETPLSPESRIRYLLSVLEQAGNYLLCLDNFELVNESHAIDALCTDLLHSASQGKMWLLAMSRVTPRFLHHHRAHTLNGLSRQDAIRLLETSGLSAEWGLPDDVLDELYDRTAGIPIFLKLFASWALGQRTKKTEGEKWGNEEKQRLASFVANMAREWNVRQYLLHEVYETLSPPERRFLTCVSVFRSAFETEDEAIVTLLADEGVQDIEATWMALAGRHIFTHLEGQDAISLHPLLREYFCHRLRMRPEERERIHLRVGAYYEKKVEDALEASYHYLEAGDAHAGRAARLLSGNVDGLIVAGQARPALEQLERLIPRLAHEAAGLRFEAAAAREKIYHLFGQRKKQRTALNTMLALAEELDAPAAPRLRSEQADQTGRRLAVAHNRRARFHEALGEFAAAIAAAQAGLEAARQAGDKTSEVQSLNLWGRALQKCGDYLAARQKHEQALALARGIGDRRQEATALNNLGVICFYMGNVTTACDFYEQSLAIWRALGDRHKEATALNNLGVACCVLGKYTAASEYYEQSLAIERDLGNRMGEALSLHNLGDIRSYLGDYTTARVYLEQALAISRAIGDRHTEGFNLISLGESLHIEGEYTTAREYHQQALALQQDIGEGAAGYALTGLGMDLEALGNLDEAAATYREALKIWRERGQAALAIEDVAGLARVALARDEQAGKEEARRRVEECLAHIAVHGVEGIDYLFDVYLTCVRVLQACGEGERARGLLAEAYALLMERAATIEDETLRHSFLNNVPAHRELVQQWANSG